MFSFFKRGKSKDDGDKKEKSKEKSSFSPFSKRQDSVKKNSSASTQEQTSTLFDSRLSSGFTGSQVPKGLTAQGDSTLDNAETSTQNTKPPPHSITSEGFQTEPCTKLESSVGKDEHDYSLPSCDLPTLAETTRSSSISDQDSWRSVVFERAGSSDRGESDGVFKTAPNTPVLPKHFTSVYSDELIDSTDLVSESSQPLPELSQSVNEPVHIGKDTPKEVKKPLQIVLESIQDIEEPCKLVSRVPNELPHLETENLQPIKEYNTLNKELPQTLKELKDLETESSETLTESNTLNSESCQIGKEPQVVETDHPQIVSVSTSPLGADLDFPTVDGEETCDNEAEYSNIPQEVFCEAANELQENCETSQCEGITPVSQNEERDKCVNMSQSPGELYDIMEEETSEEEEQSEEEQEEDDDDDEDSGNVTQPTIEEEYPEEIFKKNLVNQEAQSQLQERVSDLTARLSAREAESNKLLCQIDDLQHDVMVKTGGMDRLQAELNAAHKESECIRKRLRKLEEDLDTFKEKNAELREELQKRSEEVKNSEDDGFDFNHLLELEQEVKELTAKVKDLESQLEQMRQERDKLEQEARQLAEEREEEKRIVQEALDTAMAEKEAIQTKFEKDFEKLRTVNTDREQQLLDDFEWKLREVEQACKKRLDEKEKQAKQRIKAAEDKLKAVEGDLAQLESLKHFEAEASQLKSLNLEQQRALRFAERTKEQLQVSEKVLHEEVKKLKELLTKEKAALTTMQAIHNREIDEKDRKMKFRLEQQKTELNTQWEEKLKKETIRLKVELDQIYRDERRLTLEAARVEKEGELQKAKEKWEKRFQELVKEVEILKQKIADREDEYRKNIETVRTNADRDIFDLRRKLDRIDISYQEKLEKLQAHHDKEKERLMEESERKLQSCEQNWQMQLSSTRTTLELVKEQLKREAAEQVESLHENHRRQLEEQWEQLMQERDEALEAMEERHKESMEKMKTELDAAYKCRNSREQELVDMVNKMREELNGKTDRFGDLRTEAENFKCCIQDLKHQIVSQNEIFKQTKEEAVQKIRLMEDGYRRANSELTAKYNQELSHWKTSVDQLQDRVLQLSKKLEESKDSKLLEELQKALSDKEQQVAQLSKEKHLYQLELMNRNSHGETVTARQRRKASRGKSGRPGPSRGHK